MISEERYGNYDYEIWEYMDKRFPAGFAYYYYRIIDKESHSNFLPESPLVCESDENFETAQEARFAAIGHISLLEEKVEA